MVFIIERKRWGFVLGAVLIFGSSLSVSAQMNMQLPAEMSAQTFVPAISPIKPDSLSFDESSTGTTAGGMGSIGVSAPSIGTVNTGTVSTTLPGSQLNIPAIRDLNPLSISRPRVVGCDGSLGSAPLSAEPSVQTGRCAPGYIKAEKIGFDDSKTEHCLSCGVSKRLCRNGLSQWACVERSQ